MRADFHGGPATFDRTCDAWLASHDRSETPAAWFAAGIAVTTSFGRIRECGCDGGIYDHPGAPNHKGEACYRCKGTGRIAPADTVRNAWYDAFSVRDDEARQAEREAREGDAA